MNLDQRSAGVLLHITSLPGPHGIGDFGPGARQFVDWLAAAGQRVWQILPSTNCRAPGPKSPIPCGPGREVMCRSTPALRWSRFMVRVPLCAVRD